MSGKLLTGCWVTVHAERSSEQKCKLWLSYCQNTEFKSGVKINSVELILNNNRSGLCAQSRRYCHNTKLNNSTTNRVSAHFISVLKGSRGNINVVLCVTSVFWPFSYEIRSEQLPQTLYSMNQTLKRPNTNNMIWSIKQSQLTVSSKNPTCWRGWLWLYALREIALSQVSCFPEWNQSSTLNNSRTGRKGGNRSILSQ